jgi:hypothetical protein
MTDQQHPPTPPPEHPFQRHENHEPAPNPVRALFGGADPCLVDAVDAGAAAVAIECAATQLALSLAGGPPADVDASPRVVRVRDAAVALARAAVLGAHALGATERPSPSSHGASVDAAVARLAEVIVGFDAAGGSAILAPADPEEPIEAYGQRRHLEARDGLLELVRAVAASAAAGNPAPRVAAGTAEERYRRAVDAEAYAERAYRAAREATDVARDAVLSARARTITAENAS